MTFEQLFKTMWNKFAKWRRDYQNAEDIKLDSIVPQVGLRGLVFKFKVQSSSRRKFYTTYVQFLEVEFGDRLESGDWTWVEYKGKKYYFKKPSMMSSPVRVRCNCPDFVHRFAWPNRKVQALYGPPPKKYVPVKPPSGRPPTNPKSIPGFCYHVYQCTKFLEHRYVKLTR